MIRAILVFLAAALSCSTVVAATDAARMDEVTRYYADHDMFMGNVLVAKGEDVVFSKSYRSANLELDVPHTLDSKFRIGSVTKQFTAAAILLLEQRGKLALTDAVKTYYPDAPATWDKITLLHLLGHTSGIPNYTNTPDLPKLSASHVTPAELVKLVQDQPLEFEPGSTMSYSNTGYVLLGMVIEKASGTSYAEFLDVNLFKPSGMTNTGYDVNAAVLPHRAAGYKRGPSGLENSMYVDMTTPFAAGALYSTVGDLLRWERALFGKKILSMESLNKMTTPGKGDYGMGLFIHPVGARRVIEHGGGIPGFNSRLTYFPESDVTVVALSNLNGPGPDLIVEKLGALAHGDIVVLPPERKSIAMRTSDVRRYVGNYQLDPGTMFKVSLDKEQLMARFNDEGAFPLRAETRTRFFPEPFEAQIEFQMDAKGKVTGLLMRQNGRDTLAKRVEH